MYLHSETLEHIHTSCLIISIKITYAIQVIDTIDNFRYFMALTFNCHQLNLKLLIASSGNPAPWLIFYSINYLVNFYVYY